LGHFFDQYELRRLLFRVTGKMSDHSIYLRVPDVYVHEITQGLLLGR
jgi:hypothetical protein